jgi:hypothetical protein
VKRQFPAALPFKSSGPLREWIMPQKSDKSQKPLFLMSPPGSREAADIGYINIPKIVKEPPSELVEVQEFTDNTGSSDSTQESHFWVYRPFIESKKARGLWPNALVITDALMWNFQKTRT